MRIFPLISVIVIAATRSLIWSPSPLRGEKEFLTPQEISKLQDAQQVDERIKVYMEAATLRLKASEDRLNGKESQPGDPLEFFSVEDMLDGYYSIVRSVMFVMDDAVQSKRTEKAKLGKALKSLKSTMEKSSKDLEILKRMAEEKQREETWNLVNKAIDITKGALDGADLGLSREPPSPAKKGKEKS